MSTSIKLTASFISTSLTAAAIGFVAAKYAQSGHDYFAVAASIVGLALLIVSARVLIGLSMKRQLGLEPEELERRASEIASGYLDGPWARELDGLREESAGARLAESVDRLGEVFRRTNEAAKAAIIAGHRIRAAACMGFSAETRPETLQAADELLTQASALEEAISFYSFERNQSGETPRDSAEEPKPQSRPRLRLLPREEGKAEPSKHPPRGQRPKLTLLRSPRKEA